MQISASQDSQAVDVAYNRQPMKSSLSWPMTAEEYQGVLNAKQPVRENEMISKAFRKFDTIGDPEDKWFRIP